MKIDGISAYHKAVFVIANLVLSCGEGFAVGATQVVPSELTNSEGGSGAHFDDQQRMQLVYGSSLFSTFPAGGGEISELRFRVNNPGFAFTGTWDLQVNISTSSAAEGTLSRAFSANLGGDDQIALPRTTLNISSDYTPNGANSLSVVVPLPNHFRYDPSKGNLLLDVRSFARSGTPGVPFFDAQLAAGDGLAIVYGGLNDTQSFLAPETAGFVTAFTFSPIPEPSTGLLMIISLTFASILLRGKNVVA